MHIDPLTGAVLLGLRRFSLRFRRTVINST